MLHFEHALPFTIHIHRGMAISNGFGITHLRILNTSGNLKGSFNDFLKIVSA
jgi:hypothetical protein